MKQRQKTFFGIAVLMIAVIFTMTACGGNDPSGGGIATRFNFNNDKPPVSLNMIVPKSAAGISRAMMQGTTKDTASFSEIDSFYSGLGTRVSQFTPAEFSLELMGIYTMTNGQEADLYYIQGLGGAKIDFKNGVSFTPTQNAEAGATTTAVKIMFNWSGQGTNPIAKVAFTIPSNVADAIRNEADSFHAGAEMYYVTKGIVNLSGTTLTMNPFQLLPESNGEMVGHFIFAGLQYRYTSDAVGGFVANTVKSFVIPMRDITIPSSATSVTYKCTMDLTNIIEQYPDNTFVLAKDFWERLAIDATPN